jgi:uncharacterized protein YidB (DUF937 family)
MQRRWIASMSGMALAVALGAAIVAAPTWAQGTSPPANPPTEQSRRGAAPGWLDTVSSALGMTPAELRTELRAGHSVAEIAAARGVDMATVKQAITARLRERLDAAVAAGRLTQQQADARFAQIEQRLDQWLTATPPQGRAPRAPGRHLGPPGPGALRGQEALDSLAGRLGLSGDQLRAELRGGRSLADIAAAQGIDQSALLTAITDVARERLNAAVAAGRLTQQQADALLGVVQAFAPNWITRTPHPPASRERPPQPPAGPRGPRGGNPPAGQ